MEYADTINAANFDLAVGRARQLVLNVTNPSRFWRRKPSWKRFAVA
ncbi:MAG: hypothetical protein H0X36_13240 [Sphingomonadaceae bacterium]|nr:hypothetical protein [Sphingomonadaceae bacterium]